MIYPGGLASYIMTARELLADSKAGNNPFHGFSVNQIQHAAFVLVAGGLGERLGYNGIKVALTMETTTGTCFLQHYIDSILCLSKASCTQTKDDTYTKTLQLLESNSYFGMKSTYTSKTFKTVEGHKWHCKFMEKVDCLADNDARLAVNPHNKYRIQKKPHGHGDVHSFLYSSGLLKEWYGLCFFKTRMDSYLRFISKIALIAIPAALGSSMLILFLFLKKPKKQFEALQGLLIQMLRIEMVINVEYNELDTLLRATSHPDGDVNCDTGFSPYPGNINRSDFPDLILEVGPYMDELSKTGGSNKGVC
uniref:UTP-monosaccharide-1-phosphate uridylyltransferase n=1 Tax=Lactuca sativa TaxID=4236 RepID=A0A9R1V8X9_LACSA|nr:hypothetical protein LSAT_V11C600315320 [Lactuca sativa]